METLPNYTKVFHFFTSGVVSKNSIYKLFSLILNTHNLGRKLSCKRIITANLYQCSFLKTFLHSIFKMVIKCFTILPPHVTKHISKVTKVAEWNITKHKLGFKQFTAIHEKQLVHPRFFHFYIYLSTKQLVCQDLLNNIEWCRAKKVCKEAFY